ncbi:RidA family protein [Suttonella indologenes]|uniref:Enamine/imine deaminase n=1 Tax=Suttonella indologenes TaxID=13276 RepID=A0A380MJJ2_9GAMM|nr:RidA family protein [Suttonella indologenes]SUO91561.1 Enamine/imine deaminase [Suttonella indologenes]
MFEKQIIQSDKAPKAIGPYSQAVRVGDLVFVSGQIPLDPNTGELVGEDFKAQAEQVIDNLAAICQAAGGDLSNIVKLNVYLTDLSRFAEFNEVMNSRFAAPYPARAALGISALPKGAQVEAEAVLALA